MVREGLTGLEPDKRLLEFVLSCRFGEVPIVAQIVNLLQLVQFTGQLLELFILLLQLPLTRAVELLDFLSVDLDSTTEGCQLIKHFEFIARKLYLCILTVSTYI